MQLIGATDTTAYSVVCKVVMLADTNRIIVSSSLLQVYSIVTFLCLLVSTLPGLLMSLDLYSTLTLEEARSLQPLAQFMVSVTLKGWAFPQDKATPKQLLKPTRILLHVHDRLQLLS